MSCALDSLRDAAFDGIFHLAASVGVRLIVDDPVRAAENNLFEIGRAHV